MHIAGSPNRTSGSHHNPEPIAPRERVLVRTLAVTRSLREAAPLFVLPSIDDAERFRRSAPSSQPVRTGDRANTPHC
jgi:hypothetical protein